MTITAQQVIPVLIAIGLSGFGVALGYVIGRSHGWRSAERTLPERVRLAVAELCTCGHRKLGHRITGECCGGGCDCNEFTSVVFSHRRSL